MVVDLPSASRFSSPSGFRDPDFGKSFFSSGILTNVSLKVFSISDPGFSGLPDCEWRGHFGRYLSGNDLGKTRKVPESICTYERKEEVK